MQMKLMLGAAMVALVAVGPATSRVQAQSATSEVKPQKPKSGGTNYITPEEVEYSKASTALEVIQRMRPAMLRVRMGPGTDRGEGVEIVVWLDGVRLGGPDNLGSVDAARVKDIRYLNATDATQRFGTGHTAGAIVVTTKK